MHVHETKTFFSSLNSIYHEINRMLPKSKTSLKKIETNLHERTPHINKYI